MFGLAQEHTVDTLPQALREIVIVNKNPIAAKYASIQLNKMEVYFNPASSGDPLKAIVLLPFSTNTTESANPVLRGGQADQSRVYLNGAPIANPVRNTQENGIGNFSLFNTEMIDNQYVYASNPPLTYGNSSAGIVAIETTKELERDSYQVVSALSSVGLQVNKKVRRQDFFQLYGNFQFSDGLKAINKGSLADLNAFQSIDGGLNFRVKLTPRIAWNSYTYAIDERYNALKYQLAYRAKAEADQKRAFTVNTLEYSAERSLFKVVSLADWSQTSYRFKTIDAKGKSTQLFFAFSHKYRINTGWNVQYGVDLSLRNYAYDEVRPLHFYALEDNHPTQSLQETVSFTAVEWYGYTEYKFTNQLGVSVGMRKSIQLQEKKFDFFSAQFSAFYAINAFHRFILGLGNYNSYATPNYYDHQIRLIHSKQLALDYYYERGNTALTGAIYVKKDSGQFQLSAMEQETDQQMIGIEGSFTQQFNRYMSFFLANTLLYQTDEVNATTTKDWMYFTKAQITYANPKVFTASLVCITHPGGRYTQLNTSVFDETEKVFVPMVTAYNNEKLNSYFRLDLTMNKLFPMGKHYLIAYCTISNILNRKNDKSPYYTEDYSHVFFQSFQGRVVYIGLQFKF